MSSRTSLFLCAAATLCVLILAGCGYSPAGSSRGVAETTLTPHGTPLPPTPTLTAPPGWTTVFSKLEFTSASTRGGLVASAAQPGRVVGCGMSVPTSKPAAPPTFILSDDSGQTWQTRAVPGLPSSAGCTVFADTVQPNTFALVLATTPNVPMYFTRDTGATWQTLDAVPEGDSPSPIALVNGQLLAASNPPGMNSWRLLEASLNTRSWQVLNQALPNSEYIPLVAAVDQEDSATIYVDGVVGSVLTIYRSSDSGATWHAVLALPTAHHIALLTMTRHRIVAEQLDGQDTDQPLYYSSNGGATWQGMALHDKSGGEVLSVSPQGRVITKTSADATSDRLYTLDPTTSSFTPLGAYVLGPGAPLAAVVDGPAPALLYAAADHLWRLALHT